MLIDIQLFVKILHFSFKKIKLLFCRKEKAITFAAALIAKFIRKIGEVIISRVGLVKESQVDLKKEEKTLKKFWRKEKGYYLCRPVTKGTKAEREGRREERPGSGSS